MYILKGDKSVMYNSIYLACNTCWNKNMFSYWIKLKKIFFSEPHVWWNWYFGRNVCPIYDAQNLWVFVVVVYLAATAINRQQSFANLLWIGQKLKKMKSNFWLMVWNQNNVSEWNDMSIHWLLFQWAITINIQPSVLV